MVQTGCCKAEFDSAYPIHLNGIISQHEFQESINNINQALRFFKRYLIITWILYTVTLVAGIACIICGAVVSRGNESDRSVFYILLGFGICLIVVGSILPGIVYCIVYSKRMTRMRQAIANESKRYSSRSSIPCSWRLDALAPMTGEHQYYSLVIDIGQSYVPENRTCRSNQVAPESKSFEGQDNYGPPAYSGSFT